MGVLSELVHNLPKLPKRSATQSANPITLLTSLSALQWAFFLSAELAWICDAIDFFATSLAASRLVTAFGKDLHAITTSITLTLLFRPLGAVIFGLLSDRYGRKWPLIANLIFCGIFSLASGFAKTFGAFLGLRCMFGIGMGGIWGAAASLALENAPVEARGLLSGLMQQGYAVGYLIIATVNLNKKVQGDYRILFFVAAGISFFAALVRLIVPESTYFVERSRAAREAGDTVSAGTKSKIFLKSAGQALRTHWIRSIFSVLLMTGFNFYSHGSQDLYPTYIQKGKGLSPHAATVATIIGNVGAIVGGTISGYLSQYLGRRLTIIACCIWTCVFLPLWLLPTTFGPLAAGAFFVQSGVQGAWGVVPVYLAEISPVAFRAVWPGVAYQLGNMISSASAQIETTAGENIKTASGLPDYGKVSAILIGVVSAWLIALVLIGREDHSAHFEQGKAAFEEGAGRDELDAPNAFQDRTASDTDSTEKGEKSSNEVRKEIA